MEINLTLVIQIFNFAVAWWILHICYFRPAITYIYDTQRAYDQLKQGLIDWQGNITQKEDAISSMWNRFKVFSKQHMPEPVKQVQEVMSVAGQSELSISSQEINQLAYALQDKIVLEVSNVDL